MKSSAELRAQFQATSSPHARKAILAQIQVALHREREEEEALRRQIVKCRACGLNRTRNKAVPFSGPPRGRADLILVGEAPGYEEDRKGIPFVGQSGKLLDLALKQAGTSRDKCFVANTLCCRPPENRDPKPNELKACRPNFSAQVDLADCAVGVTLGAYALANVIGEDRKKISMGSYLDTPIWLDGRIWIPAYHPAYVLRNREAFSSLIDSLKFALALRHGDSETRPLPTPIWEQVEVDGTKGSNLEQSLDKKGYAFLFSRTLGTQIVVLKYEGAKYPKALSHLPHYTVDELVRVGLAGKGRRSGWTKGALRTLNMVKYELDGVVVQG